MKNGIALWLAKNTKLSLEQIADFCNIHPLQVHTLRESSSSKYVEFNPCNPIDVSLLTKEEIDRCEKDKNQKLQKINFDQKKRESAKKCGILDATLWLVNKYPDLEASVVAKLLKCSSVIVKSVKNNAYRDLDKILPKNPVSLGLCSQQDLDECLLDYS